MHSDETQAWPPWLQQVSSEAFREAYRNGTVPRFSWYQPQLLPRPPRQPQHDTPDNKDDESDHNAFFSLTRTVLSDRLDGVIAVTDAEATSSPSSRVRHEEAVLRERRVAYGVAWECVTPMEALWEGEPISTRLPPAVDYERLLLDDEDDDNDNDATRKARRVSATPRT